MAAALSLLAQAHTAKNYTAKAASCFSALASAYQDRIVSAQREKTKGFGCESAQTVFITVVVCCNGKTTTSAQWQLFLLWS